MYLAHKALKPKGWRFSHFHPLRQIFVIEFRGPVMEPRRHSSEQE